MLLRKPSYVNLRRCYLVHRDMLMLYNRHESASYFQLTPQSYAVVVKKLNFKFVEVGPAEIKKRAPKQPVEPRSSRPRITHYGYLFTVVMLIAIIAMVYNDPSLGWKMLVVCSRITVESSQVALRAMAGLATTTEWVLRFCWKLVS